MRRAVALGILLAAGAGCYIPEGGHGLRIELVHETPAAVVTETKSYFLWGLVPTRRVDVLAKCPHGATAVSERGGPRLAVPTLGLWSRRTITYYCRGPSPDQAER